LNCLTQRQKKLRKLCYVALWPLSRSKCPVTGFYIANAVGRILTEILSPHNGAGKPTYPDVVFSWRL
jgi:hypothetical protein